MSSIYAFSKRIKDQQVIHQEIEDAEDIAKIQSVIEKLGGLPRVLTSNLTELELRTNPTRWVTSLTTDFPDNINKNEMDYLLSDFTEAMRTRMREESKYAIGLLMSSGLILCHSAFGEETITPEWKTIPRMLDTGNVLRYVYFINTKGNVTVEYWEREATQSFIEWLGLPAKRAFLFGGKYRIIVEIEGIITEFQLTEPEMEQWIENHPEFAQGGIKFAHPVENLRISEIMAGRRSYDDVQDFIQDWNAEKYGIARYQKEYERIVSKALPMLIKYYDEKTRLVRKEGDEEVTDVPKTTPGFDILFVNEQIVFRASYLKDIISRLVGGELLKLFHAGAKFRSSPITFGNVELYSGVSVDSLTRRLMEYYKDIGLEDKNLNMFMKYAIMKLLAEANQQSPVVHLLEPLAQGLIDLIVLDKKWTKLEDKILEYKSLDFVSGSNEEVIGRLTNDLNKKLKESPCKMYFIGVEDDGAVNPMLISKWKSDRVEAVGKGIKNALDIKDIYLWPIPVSGGTLLLLIASTL
jgi:hypothetical protein